MEATSPWQMLTYPDAQTALRIVGSGREPDLTIAPDGNPYLYRWHIIPRNADANVYFHIQVRSDIDRALHDHPWDNTSVILAGGYVEHIQTRPPEGEVQVLTRRKGDVIYRPGGTAHRLVMPKNTTYTMTLFTTGPKSREWGFWIPDTGWVHNENAVELLEGNRSVSKAGVF